MDGRLPALFATGLLLFWGAGLLGEGWPLFPRLLLGQGLLLATALVAASGRARLDGLACRSTLFLRPLPLRDMLLVAALPVCFSPALSLIGEELARLLPGHETQAEALRGFLSATTDGGNLGTAILFLAILPAICEEFFFRGLLLGESLRHCRGILRPALASGLLFGLFHLDPYRFLPLSLLGTLIAAVVLFTRSLPAAILYHFLNNLLVLAAAGSDFPDSAAFLPVGLFLPLPGLLALRMLYRRHTLPPHSA
jgi:membrane protease YdiL (CAAX protease family)